MELDKNKILEYQQNRDPYLFIDYVTNLEPGNYILNITDQMVLKMILPKLN